MGSWGTGKSEAWCAIAKWLAQGKSENVLHVLDTDQAVDRLVEGQPYEAKVQPYDLFEWDDYINSIEKATKAAHPNRSDWLVLDMADKAWEKVQDHYIEKAFGRSADEHFLQWKTAGNSGSPLAGEYGANWQVINKLYANFMGKLTRFPGHVLACTPVDSINAKEEKSKEVLDTYGRFGAKPRGQKALGHQFHTLLLTQQKSKGEWVYTTVKDRKRAELAGEKVADFVTSYLVKVAGWKL
jgi:hypothetical protein